MPEPWEVHGPAGWASAGGQVGPHLAGSARERPVGLVGLDLVAVAESGVGAGTRTVFRFESRDDEGSDRSAGDGPTGARPCDGWELVVPPAQAERARWTLQAHRLGIVERSSSGALARLIAPSLPGDAVPTMAEVQPVLVRAQEGTPWHDTVAEQVRHVSGVTGTGWYVDLLLSGAPPALPEDVPSPLPGSLEYTREDGMGGWLLLWVSEGGLIETIEHASVGMESVIRYPRAEDCVLSEAD